MAIKLLTTTACPKCPIAKEMMSVAKIPHSLLIDDDAVAVAEQLDITTVPTLVDELGQVWSGINEIQRFIDKWNEERYNKDGEIIK